MISKFDYIILGGGCAGLSLVKEMLSDPFFKSKRIAIIEKEIKNENDRTWCWWEKGNSPWDEFLTKKWETAIVKTPQNILEYNIQPFAYKMLRSDRFYEEINREIGFNPRIKKIQATVEDVLDKGNYVQVNTNEGVFYADHVFNSIFSIEDLKKKDSTLLYQHFGGWFVRFKNPILNDQKVTLMDFSVDQNNQTCFMYILPTTSQEALFEMTYFSPFIPIKKHYEKRVEAYLLAHFPNEEYIIEEKEFGVIPMSAVDLKQVISPRVTHIGTAGGATKPSTGYTFYFIQQQVKLICHALRKEIEIPKRFIPFRFRLYDALFLNVLYFNNAIGSKIFINLFKSNNITTVLSFLAHRSTLKQELGIILKSPALLFLKSMLRPSFWIKLK